MYPLGTKVVSHGDSMLLFIGNIYHEPFKMCWIEVADLSMQLLNLRKERIKI